MTQKTRLVTEEHRQDIQITRDFELPLALLFKAFEDPEIVAQWMNTNVLKLDNRPHGAYAFETRDPQGNVVFRANGVIHAFVPNERIVRTFEMENSPFPVQLEFLDFESLMDDTSRLNMQIVYRSAEARAQMLRLPFAHGLNMAHNRLEEIIRNLHLK